MQSTHAVKQLMARLSKSCTDFTTVLKTGPFMHGTSGHSQDKWRRTLFFTCLNFVGLQYNIPSTHLGCSGIQLGTAEANGKNCIYCVRTSGQHSSMHLHTTSNLRTPITLICMSLDCGKKRDYLKKTH